MFVTQFLEKAKTEKVSKALTLVLEEAPASILWRGLKDYKNDWYKHGIERSIKR